MFDVIDARLMRLFPGTESAQALLHAGLAVSSILAAVTIGRVVVKAHAIQASKTHHFPTALDRMFS